MMYIAPTGTHMYSITTKYTYKDLSLKCFFMTVRFCVCTECLEVHNQNYYAFDRDDGSSDINDTYDKLGSPNEYNIYNSDRDPKLNHDKFFNHCIHI